jgi:hypothetical protein
MAQPVYLKCEKIIEDFSYWIECIYEELSDEFWINAYDNGDEYILDSNEEDFNWFIRLMDETPKKAAKTLEKVKTLKKFGLFDSDILN